MACQTTVCETTHLGGFPQPRGDITTRTGTIPRRLVLADYHTTVYHDQYLIMATLECATGASTSRVFPTLVSAKFLDRIGLLPLAKTVLKDAVSLDDATEIRLTYPDGRKLTGPKIIANALELVSHKLAPRLNESVGVWVLLRWLVLIVFYFR